MALSGFSGHLIKPDKLAPAPPAAAVPLRYGAAGLAMELLLIRHAEPAYPADALTAVGRRQAQALAARLAAAGIDRIFTSPMQRARATAAATAERTGLAVVCEEWMRELEDWVIADPARGEAPAWEVDAAAVRSAGAAPGDWHRLGPLAAAGLGARFAELGRASDGFLARLGLDRDGARYRVGEALEGPPPRRVAAFCHAGFALTWLAHLLAVPPPWVWAGFTLAPSSVTTVVFEPAGPGWAVPRCTALGAAGRALSIRG